MICDFCFGPVADEGGHIFRLTTIDSQLSTFFKASGGRWWSATVIDAPLHLSGCDSHPASLHYAGTSPASLWGYAGTSPASLHYAGTSPASLWGYAGTSPASLWGYAGTRRRSSG
jgi:hypothetical protein